MSQMRHISELLIPGYKKPILLRRHAIPRACGMALYIKKEFSATHKACFECGCHEMQVVKVCGKHNNFYICSIYRNPDLDDSILDFFLMTTMATIQENYVRSLVFIGNFNVHHRKCLNSVPLTEGHGLRALDFSSESGCEQIIHKPTNRSGNCLDYLFTDSPGVIDASVGTPIGTSGHCNLCHN